MKYRFGISSIPLLVLSLSGLALAQAVKDASSQTKVPLTAPNQPKAATDKSAAPTSTPASVQSTQPAEAATADPPDATAKPADNGQPGAQQGTTASEPLQGDASDVAALKDEVKRLHEQLDELSANVATNTDIQGLQTDVENFKYQYQRERETKSATSTRNLLVGGIVQTRFAWYSEDITTPVPAAYQYTSVNNPPVLHNRHTTFDIPNAIISFNGLLYRDYEAARNLQFQLSAAASPATSNAGLGANNINAFFTVLDANVTYQVLPTIENDGSRLSVKVGQFLVPFGLEAVTTEELKPVINNALFVPATGFNLRQLGAVAHGEFFAQYDFGYNYRQALVAFDVGTVNGNGPNRDDDNGHKDVFGRIAITIPAEYASWLRELRIGGSAYLGKQNLVNTYPAGQTVPADGGFNSLGNKNRYGVDFYYNHWPLGATYEYARFNDEVLVNNQKYYRKGKGYTFTLFYSFGQQFLSSIKNQGKFDDWWPKTYQPFFRFDRYDPDVNVENNEIALTTLGLNIFFAETTKFQLNATRRVQTMALNQSKASGEVLAQIQFGF